MASEIIFVTGANGFLGSHIVHQLLEKGYGVRGTARGAKVALTKEIFASYGDRFEVVEVNDIAVDDVSVHLKGVTALIHAAAPLPGKYIGHDSKALIKGAIDGALNVIKQAEQAGIKRVVYTSSLVTVMNASGSLTADDWNPITEEETLVAPPFMAYIGAKKIAEKAVWTFADEHKHVDFTVVNPPYLFGPFAPNFILPKPDYTALSTNIHLYHWLKREGRAFPTTPGNADIRDAARIHVGALTSPLEVSVGRKRIIFASPYDGNYKVAIQLLEKERPELRDRLVDASTAPEFPYDKLPVDLKRVQEVTGVKLDSYRTWKETVLDTFDSLLGLEKNWVSKGYKIDIPALEDYGF